MLLRLAVILLAVILVLISGCSSHRQDTLGAPSSLSAPASTQPLKQPGAIAYHAPVPEEGSLWVDPGGSKLFGDMRAREIGDLVTIRISESPTAQLSAKTETKRDSGIEADVTDLAGYMKWLEAANGKLVGDNLIKTNFKPSFTGEGTNDRKGSITAYVTGRVVAVLPNGNLQISGSRAIKVNNETQYITISGIIRPEDIDPNNQIQSTYIADAHIEYSGKGVIAAKQMPGWGTRILDRVWPF